MTGDPRLRLRTCLLLISAGRGSGFLMIEVAADSMPPFAIATCRGGVSAVAPLLFVLDERIGPVALAGVAVVLVRAWLVTHRSRGRSPRPSSP